MTLTEREVDLLETLTLRIPMLAFAQAAEVWWPESPKLLVLDILFSCAHS